LSSFKFNLENVSLFFGFLDESNGVSSSSNFGFDEILHRGVEMSFEFIKSYQEFSYNSSFSVVSVR